MRIQVRAKSLTISAGQDVADVVFEASAEGEVISIHMSYPIVKQMSDVTEVQILRDAWSRAQQILRSAATVGQPDVDVGAEQR